MPSNILSCRYSYHTQRFHIQYANGISSYLFRLQTEGSCEANVRGERVRLGRPHRVSSFRRAPHETVHRRKCDFKI